MPAMGIFFIVVSSLVFVTVVLMKSHDLWLTPIKRRLLVRRAMKHIDQEYRELTKR